jgi:hypothetical protein
MLEPTNDTGQIIERIAALDIGKAEVSCCVRVPDPERPGGRLQEVVTYSTMTRSLLGLCDRLAGLGVTRVLMEATGDYWKSPFYLLEAAGFDTWLVNAKDVKHLPGRPKKDTIDAVWLCTDQRPAGGVRRVSVQRPPRVPAGQDAGPGRRDRRRHRRRRGPHRRPDRPFR